MSKGIKYTAGLIALYLLVYNGSKSGKLFTAGSRGAVDIIESLQGR